MKSFSSKIFFLGMVTILLFSKMETSFGKDPFDRASQESEHFFLLVPNHSQAEMEKIINAFEQIYQEMPLPKDPTNHLRKITILFEGTNKTDHKATEKEPLIIYPQNRSGVYETLFEPNRWPISLLRFQTYIALYKEFHRTKAFWKPDSFFFNHIENAQPAPLDPFLKGLALYVEEQHSLQKPFWESIRKLALRQLPKNFLSLPHRLPPLFPFNPDLAQGLVVSSFWKELETKDPIPMSRFVNESLRNLSPSLFKTCFGKSIKQAWKEFLQKISNQTPLETPSGLAHPISAQKTQGIPYEPQLVPGGKLFAFLERAPLEHDPILKIYEGENLQNQKKIPQGESLKWLHAEDGLMMDTWKTNALGHTYRIPMLVPLKGPAHLIPVPPKSRYSFFWERREKFILSLEEAGIENFFSLYSPDETQTSIQITTNISSELHFSQPAITAYQDLFFFNTTDENGRETILQLNAARGSLEKLLAMPSHQIHPHVAFNEKYVLFSSDLDGTFSVFACRLDDRALFRLAGNQEEDLFWPSASNEGEIMAASLKKGAWKIKTFKVDLPLNDTQREPLKWLRPDVIEEAPPSKPETIPETLPETIPETLPETTPETLPETQPKLPSEKKVSRGTSYGFGFRGDPVERGALVGMEGHWFLPKRTNRFEFNLAWHTEATHPVGQIHYLDTKTFPYLELRAEEKTERVTSSGSHHFENQLLGGFLLPEPSGKWGFGFGVGVDGVSLDTPYHRRWFSGPYVRLQIPLERSKKVGFFPQKYLQTNLIAFYWVDTFSTLREHHPEILLRTSGSLPFGSLEKESVAGAIEAGFTQGISETLRFSQMGGDLSYLWKEPDFLIRGYPFQGQVGQKPLAGHLEFRHLLAVPHWGLPTGKLEALSLALFGDVGNKNFTSQEGWLVGSGAEGRAHLLIAKRLSFLLRIGWHRGWSSGGQNLFFVGLGQPWY